MNINNLLNTVNESANSLEYVNAANKSHNVEILQQIDKISDSTFSIERVEEMDSRVFFDSYVRASLFTEVVQLVAYYVESRHNSNELDTFLECCRAVENNIGNIIVRVYNSLLKNNAFNAVYTTHYTKQSIHLAIVRAIEDGFIEKIVQCVIDMVKSKNAIYNPDELTESANLLQIFKEQDI